MIPQVEQNYYKDIRRIAKALEGIEKHLSTIAESYKPLTYDPITYDMGRIFGADLNHEDDGK